MTGIATLHRPIAHRYELDLPLLYRRQGDAAWQNGRTVNASRTGVLFEAAGEVFAAGTAIELQLELPGFTRTAKVHCTGSVVRCERGDCDRQWIAATIDLYRFGAEDTRPVTTPPLS